MNKLKAFIALDSASNKNNLAINHKNLAELCRNVETDKNSNFYVLKLKFDEVKTKVKPALWRNGEFCVYRMDPILSNNNSSINSDATTEMIMIAINDEFILMTM